MLGLAGVSPTPIVSVGWRLLVAQRWLQKGLACAGPILLPWQAQLWECLSAGTPPCRVIYNISNYFIFQTGLSFFFFSFQQSIFPWQFILWWLWAALCRQSLCLGLVDCLSDLCMETTRINLHKRANLVRGIQSKVLAVKQARESAFLISNFLCNFHTSVLHMIFETSEFCCPLILPYRREGEALAIHRVNQCTCTCLKQGRAEVTKDWFCSELTSVNSLLKGICWG